MTLFTYLVAMASLKAVTSFTNALEQSIADKASSSL